MLPCLARREWPIRRSIMLALLAILWTCDPAAAATGKFEACPSSSHTAPCPPTTCDFLNESRNVLYALGPPCTYSSHNPTLADVGIMLELRRALHDSGGPWSGGLPGWNPSDPPNPCHWSGVECSNGTRVTHM